MEVLKAFVVALMVKAKRENKVKRLLLELELELCAIHATSWSSIEELLKLNSFGVGAIPIENENITFQIRVRQSIRPLLLIASQLIPLVGVCDESKRLEMIWLIFPSLVIIISQLQCGYQKLHTKVHNILAH
jgi:hypothetical protein